MVPEIRARIAQLLPVPFRSYVARHTGSYRAVVGPAGEYDVSGASQFNLLTLLGLREHHYLLDVGCGSLRSGRLFIAYLQPGRYFGIEPEPWLVEAAIRSEVGRDLLRLKRPVFDRNDAFRLSVFGRKFDFVLASSIFSHATQAQIRICLGEARQVMRPESLFVASFVPGSSNYDGDRWTYPGTVTYTLERIRELAAEQRLVCEPVEWPYVYGTGRQIWVALTPVG
jgi:SAM-dependent methyltransferase